MIRGPNYALAPRVSKEEDLAESHTIVPNGYDIGRYASLFD